ncbi:cell envelope integrity TolA C-terminal domain-containing protein [Citrobacter freundii]
MLLQSTRLKSFLVLIVSTIGISYCLAETYTPQNINKPTNQYWINQAKAIVNDTKELNKFKGQSCTLQVEFSQSAEVIETKVIEGDQPLCDAFRNRLKSVKLPPFPDAKTWEDYNEKRFVIER